MVDEIAWRQTSTAHMTEEGNAMTAREIYTKAVQAAREEHARLVRQFIAGKIPVCPCGIDMEKDALITAFDEALKRS